MDAEERAMLRADAKIAMQICGPDGMPDVGWIEFGQRAIEAVDALDAAEDHIRHLYEEGAIGRDMQDVAWARYERACANLDAAEARERALRKVLEHAYAMLGPNDDLAMFLPDDWDERLRLGENPLLDEIVAALAASTNEEQ